jgi:PIN domain nuclease of toxin-antitoxin system
MGSGNGINDRLLLLDTHSWLWAQLGQAERFSRAARSAIDTAADGGLLRVSVISVWELSMLENRGRVSLPVDVRTWVREAMEKPGVFMAPLTPEIAIESNNLPGNLHGDPADRILAATARILGATLLTKDRRLLEYASHHYVRAVSA